MNIIFIGSVEISEVALKATLALKDKNINIIGIVTKEISKFNADHKSLVPLAKAENIPYFIYQKETTKELVAWINKLNPDLIYCIGWSHILPVEILKIPRLGSIGYHPAKLPQNRGRHPIVWALALGLTETVSSFFFMKEGVDSGDLISQKLILISNTDDARSLYEKLKQAVVLQIYEISLKLRDSQIERIPQDEAKAGYWRKRSKADGQIDWHMPATTVYNLVRALTRPYVGAHCVYNGNEAKIWQTEVVKENAGLVEPGKVLKVDKNMIWIQCSKDILLIKKHEIFPIPKVGTYL